MKKKMLPFIGILLLGSATALFSWYEFLGGREYINYTDAVVFKEDIKRGEIITLDMLKEAKVDRTGVLQGAIQHSEEIIGKQAKHFIPANAQIHPYYIDAPEFVLEGHQYVANIPHEWLYTFPSSIRRGDTVVLYTYYPPTPEGFVPPKSTPQTVSSANQNGEPIEQISEMMNEQNNTIETLLQTKVIYVKDSNNREVRTVSEEERLDGSAQVKNIEIVTTREEFKQVEKAINSGAKLVVMYTDNDSLVAMEGEKSNAITSNR